MFCQVAKKLVDSDFKNHRVEDPTRISSRQENQVKKYVKDFFDKVVAQKKAHEQKKAEYRAARERKEANTAASPTLPTPAEADKETQSDVEPGLDLSDKEGEDRGKQQSATPITPMDPPTSGDLLKRKREAEDDGNEMSTLGDSATPTKRQRSETPPPPPPPPPPAAIAPAQNAEEVPNDTIMEVERMDVESYDYLPNGTNSVPDQESLSDLATYMEGSPPPSTLDNKQGTPEDCVPDLAMGDAGEIELASPGAKLEGQGEGAFATKHLQGVQEVRVHDGRS